jgi:hypothetical protein
MTQQSRRTFFAAAIATAALALVGLGAFALANDEPPGGIKMPGGPRPTPLVNVIPEPPMFPATGGPFIGEQAALNAATEIAHSPVARQDVRFMRYRDVVAFTGNRTHTIDLDREVYFVVTSGTFVGRHGQPTCLSYTAVIDATTGVGLSVSCGDGAWPSRLPLAFG